MTLALIQFANHESAVAFVMVVVGVSAFVAVVLLVCICILGRGGE